MKFNLRSRPLHEVETLAPETEASEVEAPDKTSTKVTPNKVGSGLDNLIQITGNNKEQISKAACLYIKNSIGTGSLYNYINSDPAGNGGKLAVVIREVARNFKGAPAKLSKFLNIVDAKVPFDTMGPRYFPNLLQLAHNIVGDKFQDNNEAISNITLWKRPDREFIYALQIFNSLADDATVKKFFPNLTPQSIGRMKKALYSGNKIKPSGNTEKDRSENTIHGVIEIFGEVQRQADGSAKSSDSGSSNNSLDKSTPTFKSFKDAEKSGAKIVNIVGKFQYNAAKKEWEPVA